MTKLIVNPEIVFREEGDSALLFNPDTGEIKILNETGAFIYSHLDGTRSLDDIVQLIMAHFDGVDQDIVKQDLDELVQSLLQSNLIGEVV